MPPADHTTLVTFALAPELLTNNMDSIMVAKKLLTYMTRNSWPADITYTIHDSQ